MNFSHIGIDTRRRLILVLAGVCGLGSLIIEYGTYPGAVSLTLARCLSGLAALAFVAEQVTRWRQLDSFRLYFRERWPAFVLSILLLLEGLVLFFGRQSGFLGFLMEKLSIGSWGRAYLVAIQFYILAVLAVEIPNMHRHASSWRIRPAVLFVLSFVGLILLGTCLLLLPRATPVDQPLGVLDATFTATSAVCVTGLVVRDTGVDFTLFGQTIILILIQLGGLGIMSLTATLSLLLGRGVGVRENSLLREIFQVPVLSAVGRTVRYIVLMTIGFELVGAVLFYIGLRDILPADQPIVFISIFHAVSAFCNAGFSTFSDSLVGVAGQPLVMGTAAGLLIIGGLGFGVIAQLVAWLYGRALRKRGQRPRLRLQHRVVLTVTAILLFGGTIVLAILEWNNSLAGHGIADKLSLAFFQSATCRTAGFNSLDLTTLTPASLFLMIILMFIGGAPGSTAGGVKVTAVAIVWANLRSVGAGLSKVRLGNRELKDVQVHRAMLVMSIGLVLAAISIFILLATERQPMLETTFEVFSALGTVGLSLGLTPTLGTAGRLVIIILMFVGRLGPLTLASSLTGTSREPRVRLPKGEIGIG